MQNGANIGQRLGLSDKDTQKLNKMYCDADSSSDDESQVPLRKPNKKENSKNKPFEGHGIGYQQGKTVVIKLPAVKTYRLPDIPKFHLFDYFSKAPQVLSQTLTEKKGIREGVVLQHELIAPMPADERHPVLSKNGLLDQFRIIEMRPEAEDSKISPPIPKENFVNYKSNIKQYINNIMFVNEDEKDGLDKDNKPIELDAVSQGEGRDYPIEVSDIYKIKNDYSGFYTTVPVKDKIVNYNTNMNRHVNENNSDNVPHRPNSSYYGNKDFSKDSNGNDFEEERDSSFKTSNPAYKENVYKFVPRLNEENFYHRDDFKGYEPSIKKPSGGDWNNNYEFKGHNDDYNLDEEKKDFHQLEMKSPKSDMRQQYAIADNTDWVHRF